MTKIDMVGILGPKEFNLQTGGCRSKVLTDERHPRKPSTT